MAATLVTWGAYAAYVALRAFGGLHGRRAAYFALAGFALVVLVRIGLQVTHF
jgi:ABC-type transport system involved in cytochrome c biogenesis permease subunit